MPHPWEKKQVPTDNTNEHGFYCQQNVTEIKQITRAPLAFAFRMALSVDARRRKREQSDSQNTVLSVD